MKSTHEIRQRFIKEREKICSQAKFEKWLKRTHNIKVSQQSISNFEKGAAKNVPHWMRDVCKAMGSNYERVIGEAVEEVAEPRNGEKMTPGSLLRLFEIHLELFDDNERESLRGGLKPLLEPKKTATSLQQERSKTHASKGKH